MTTNVLHWGIFVGPSLSTSGTLHNYVSRGAQSYVYEKDEHYTPKASSNDQFVVAHRVGEVSTSDALLFETKLSGIQIPPGADCQRWVFTALNHLQKQLLGWIDVPPMAPLRDHMPSRERPRGVFHSTVGTLRDLKELDSSDYTRIASIDAGRLLFIFSLPLRTISQTELTMVSLRRIAVPVHLYTTAYTHIDLSHNNDTAGRLGSKTNAAGP